jgi:WhiB family redox-sensing transcriptional regulator
MIRLGWADRAACRTENPELFFPLNIEPYSWQVRRAKQVCGHCPVQLECLRYALESAQKYGVWGGATEDERRRMRARARGRSVAALASVAEHFTAQPGNAV